MLRSLLVALVVAVATSTACARIGETGAECIARYGQPTESKPYSLKFEKAGVEIAVTFYGGIPDSISFTKMERNPTGRPVEISPNEIRQLLSANGSGREWKPPQDVAADKYWETTDGEMSAQYETFKHYLFVATRGHIERYREKKAAAENANLNGF